MVRVVIVDDEELPRTVLCNLLHRHAPEVALLAEADNIVDGAAAIAEHRPQLVFLDVQMPGGDGFEMLRRMERWDFDVIFSTAHQHYAIQAIRFSALDFLLKPVQADELRAALDRHMARRGTAPEEIQRNFIANIASGDERALKLTLAHGSRMHSVAPDEIAWCEAGRNYTTLHLADDRRFVSARPLKDYDEMLAPFGFIRVHKSTLVNRHHVDGIDGEGFMRLRTGARVEVSRRRLDEVRGALGS